MPWDVRIVPFGVGVTAELAVARAQSGKPTSMPSGSVPIIWNRGRSPFDAMAILDEIQRPLGARCRATIFSRLPLDSGNDEHVHAAEQSMRRKESGLVADRPAPLTQLFTRERCCRYFEF